MIRFLWVSGAVLSALMVSTNSAAQLSRVPAGQAEGFAGSVFVNSVWVDNATGAREGLPEMDEAQIESGISIDSTWQSELSELLVNYEVTDIRSK